MATCSHEYMFFFRNRPPEESLHQTCRTFRGEVDSSIPIVFGGFLFIFFEALETSARTIENSPDKKMGVGSLHNP